MVYLKLINIAGKEIIRVISKDIGKFKKEIYKLIELVSNIKNKSNISYIGIFLYLIIFIIFINLLDTITLFSTLVGAVIGVSLPFFIERRLRKKEQLEREIRSIKEASFVLISQYQLLNSINEYISKYNKYKLGYLDIYVDCIYIDIESILFTLDTRYPSLLLKIDKYQLSVNNFFGVLKHRNELYKTWQITGGTPESAVYQEIIDSGDLLYQTVNGILYENKILDRELENFFKLYLSNPVKDNLSYRSGNKKQFLEKKYS